MLPFGWTLRKPVHPISSFGHIMGLKLSPLTGVPTFVKKDLNMAKLMKSIDAQVRDKIEGSYLNE